MRLTIVAIDLNADLGEGDPAVDQALMPLISSANIACGLHAGDSQSIAATIALAVRHGVAVGAHPGYDDRDHFGRRARALSARELRSLLLYQLGAIDAIARAEGTALHHVKPHGALYNQAASDEAFAAALTEAVRAFDPRLRVVGRAGSAMQRAAEALDHAFTPEAFADRRYNADGSLVQRTEPGAVISDPEQVAAQVRSLVTKSEVQARDGSHVQIAFETLCVHGDTPGAPALAARVRQELHTLGVTVSAPRLLGVDTLPP